MNFGGHSLNNADLAGSYECEEWEEGFRWELARGFDRSMWRDW